MACIEDETQRTFAELDFTIEGHSMVPIEPPAPDSPPKKFPTFNADKVEEAWQETSREMIH